MVSSAGGGGAINDGPGWPVRRGLPHTSVSVSWHLSVIPLDEWCTSPFSFIHLHAIVHLRDLDVFISWLWLMFGNYSWKEHNSLMLLCGLCLLWPINNYVALLQVLVELVIIQKPGSIFNHYFMIWFDLLSSFDLIYMEHIILVRM